MDRKQKYLKVGFFYQRYLYKGKIPNRADCEKSCMGIILLQVVYHKRVPRCFVALYNMERFSFPENL